jgi:hypothetical protein
MTVSPHRMLRSFPEPFPMISTTARFRSRVP